MKRSDLEAIRDMLEGGDSPAPNGHNLVGAINGMLNTYDDAQEWGATPGDEDWSDAHEDFQHLTSLLMNKLSDSVIEQDDVLEDEDGAQLASLPNPATERQEGSNLPKLPDQASSGGSRHE